MPGMAISGFRVAAEVARRVDTSIVGHEQDKLNAAGFLFTWLVIFEPLLFFGIMILRPTFAREKLAWLVSLRLSTEQPQRSIDLPPDFVRKSEHR